MPPIERTLFWPTPVPDFGPWSVTRVRNAIRAHESGDFTSSSMLADALDRNPRIRAALDTRVLGLLGLPFQMKPAETYPRRSAPIARRMQPLWPDIAPRSVLGQILRWEIRMGFCLCELVWRTSAKGWIPKLHVVHPYHVRWSDADERWEVQTREGTAVVDLSDPRWVLFSRCEDRPWLTGVVRALGMENTIREHAVRDWARRSEVYGLPVVLAKVPAKATETSKETFSEGISDMGSEGVLTLPQGATPDASFDAELMEPHDSKGELFDSLIRRIDTDVTLAILGQNLTSEVSGGSLAAAKVHDRVRLDYLESDAMLIGDVGQRQITTRVVLYNDPRTAEDDNELILLDALDRARALAPTPFYDPTPPEDAEASARARGLDADYLTKLQTLGVDIEPLLEERGLELEEEPDQGRELDQATQTNDRTDTGKPGEADDDEDQDAG